MPEKPSPRAVALGARLRALRARRFRSGSALARAAGWPQPRVSKLERGTQQPTQEDLETWVRLTDAGPGVLDELLDMLTAARLSYRHWRDEWSATGGIVAAQDEIAEIDARSQRIIEYQPAMVPGLVQTPAYARDMLTASAGPALFGASADQIEERINAQVRRQQVLYMPGKQIQLAIGEAALHTRFGADEVLAGQRDRLLAVAGLATVEIAVLPFSVPSPILPLAGFAANDDAVVWVETSSGEQRIVDPVEVAAYVAAFDRVWEASLHGRAVIDFIRAADGE